MKKVLFLLMAMIALGFQSVNAQDAPMSVSTGNPDVKVKVKRCVASGENVYIDLTITNMTGEDFEVYAVARGNGCNTVIYDDEGNEYDSERVRIRFGTDEYTTGHLYKNIIADVPMKFTIMVSNVPQKTQYFSVVRPFMECAKVPFKIQIKNLPITRD